MADTYHASSNTDDYMAARVLHTQQAATPQAAPVDRSRLYTYTREVFDRKWSSGDTDLSPADRAMMYAANPGSQPARQAATGTARGHAAALDQGSGRVGPDWTPGRARTYKPPRDAAESTPTDRFKGMLGSFGHIFGED